jgi:hypothetical protein
MDPNVPAGFLFKKTHPVWHPGGRFWALLVRGATACRGHGAEIRSPKSCDAAEYHTNPISPLPNVTPDFQKGEKNFLSKLLIFSTDCSQSMGLQSVLKIRAKTLKLFALQVLPCKGSKPRAHLEHFIFSYLLLSTRSKFSFVFAQTTCTVCLFYLLLYERYIIYSLQRF